MSSEDVQIRQPKVSDRGSAVVRRSTDSGGRPRTSVRASFGVGVAPGTYSSMSKPHLQDFKGNRQKEKKDLQDLNGRLADYIDQVHYLQAQIKKLEAENEALRARKETDLQPIRDMYEGELNESRKVLDNTAKAKGDLEGKLAGLQDELNHVKGLKSTLEGHNKDHLKKINELGAQLGETEGEIQTLRHRVESQEDENAKLRELLNKVQDNNRKLRSDLDAETAAHIEADCHAQTKEEEAEFNKELLDEFKLLQPEPIKIKGMDYKDFWKSEMAKALRNMQSVYDDKIDQIQNDCETKYSAQINTMRSGNVKDNMQLEKSRDEVKKLKIQINNMGSDAKELAMKLANLQAEHDRLNKDYGDLEDEKDAEARKNAEQMEDLNNELQEVYNQVKALLDAKMSLELEIACYKKLLEGEENRVGLRSLVEQSTDSQITGSATAELAEAIKEQQSSTLKESTGSLTVQRSSKGALAFKSMDHSGGNVVIENTSSGPRSKTINLKGWRLVKNVGNKTIVDVALLEYIMVPGAIYTLWAKGAKSEAKQDNEQIAENFSFGVGTCVWKLLDDNNAEKAHLNAKFTG